MKRLLVVTAVVVLVLGVISCAKTSQPQPYKSRYTADQVIAIAQAKYPACYRLGPGGSVLHSEQTPPSITVTLFSSSDLPPAQSNNGSFQWRPTSLDTVDKEKPEEVKWKVVISCPYGYYLGSPLSGVTSKTVYFYETDGSLHDTYYP